MSDTHTIWSKDDPMTQDLYWNYTFEDIGMEDVETFIDAVI